MIQFHSPECSVIFLPDFLNSIKIKDSFNQDELNCKEVRQLRLQAVEFQSFWRNNFVYTLGQWLGLTRAICVDQGISSSQIFSYGNGFSLLGYIILNVYWKKIEIITKTTKSVQCDSVCVTKCISFRHGKPIKIYLQWSWFNYFNACFHRIYSKYNVIKASMLSKNLPLLPLGEGKKLCEICLSASRLKCRLQG